MLRQPGAAPILSKFFHKGVIVDLGPEVVQVGLGSVMALVGL